jgi:uncharacterized protein (DUF1499 family)
MLDFRNLKLKQTPNQYLVTPKGFATATSHRHSPEFAWPAAELARRFRAVAAAEPRVTLLAEAAGGLQFELLQRSALFRFPDTISVEVLPLGEARSTLAIYSRSRYGRSDFGVNRRRIDRWLARLDETR